MILQRPALLLTLVILGSSLVWSRQNAAAHPDSAHVSMADSSAVRPDTSINADTTRMSTPALVGTLDRSLPSASLRTREDLHWQDYRSLPGILASFSGAWVQEHNVAGGYDRVWFDGADWRGVAVTMNGRSLNDPASGIYNLWQFTTEYTDRVEVVSGPRSFLYGFGAAGATINLVTKNYNSNTPFTKLNYSEGAYGYGYVDGTFSQNISRKVNLTFGFQHQVEDGRFDNSASEAWNSRVKVRYNISRDMNLIVSHTYASTQTRLNGGINYNATGTAFLFVPALATVVNPDSYEKITRHDVDLAFVGTFLGDSINVTSATVYYSHILREYRDEEVTLASNGILMKSDHVSSWSGFLLTQNLDAAFQRFQVGLNGEIRQIEGSPNLGRVNRTFGAAWAKEELSLGRALSVAAFGRLERGVGQSGAGLGADGALRLDSSFRLFGGISSAKRMPNFQELYWTDSTVYRPGGVIAEHHTLVEAGVEFKGPGAGHIQLKAFRRFVDNPILFLPYEGPASPFPPILVKNGPRLVTDGITLSGSVQFGYILLEANLIGQQQALDGTVIKDLPSFGGSGGVFFRGKLLKNALDLKAGFTGRFAMRHEGSRFNPEIVAYVPNDGPALGLNSTVNFFLIARIGDAYIHFMWENLTGANYFVSPYYPGGDRALRFGFSWEFLN